MRAHPCVASGAGKRCWRIVALAATALTACCPKPEILRLPGPVEYRDRLVIQPIPAELLRDHPIATGSIAECPRVAAQRRAELERCNNDKRALRERTP